MRKHSFYGVEVHKEVRVFGTLSRTLHRFPYLKDLDAWIKEHPFFSNDGYGRYQVYAADPEVRRIQRRIAGGEDVQFPVEI